jgi:prepilin-type N-terminal cleavage/methylation domain-containing protein
MWEKIKNNSPAKSRHQNGFTIVELLVVIVVIGILAAIVIVAYNGVQNRARTSAVVGALRQASSKIGVWQVDNGTQSPTLLSDVGIKDTDSIAFQYKSDNTVSPGTYCLTATFGPTMYYVDNTNSVAVPGACSGYNLLAWNKNNPGSALPIPGTIVDSSVYHTATSSMRIGPSSPGKLIQGSPYGGTPGQVYSVSMWLKTDPDWNGLSNNSKIRFGDAASGIPLVVCGYGGVKTSWTQVTCSYTMTSTYPSITISVGNDGTVGNIWIDDFSLSRT